MGAVLGTVWTRRRVLGGTADPAVVGGAPHPEYSPPTLVPPAVDRRETALTGVEKAKGTDVHGLPRRWTEWQDSKSPLRKKGPTLPRLSLSSILSAARRWLPESEQVVWLR